MILLFTFAYQSNMKCYVQYSAYLCVILSRLQMMPTKKFYTVHFAIANISQGIAAAPLPAQKIISERPVNTKQARVSLAHTEFCIIYIKLNLNFCLKIFFLLTQF